MTLPQSFAASPSQSFSEMTMCTAAERRQLLVEWNATRAEFPRDLCIHELFEIQAAHTPEAIALDDTENQLKL